LNSDNYTGKLNVTSVINAVTQSLQSSNGTIQTVNQDELLTKDN